ncbi:MAG: class I SAM-dependent methyltransferase [bacterium]
MQDYQDAYGHGLYDCFEGKSNYVIIERDDGYIDIEFNLKIYFSECKDWQQYQREAMKYVKGRVLDIGCGAGRYALYLQDIGFDVQGIDISPLAVEISRLRGLKEPKIMSINQISPRLGKFDTILMMGNNFGLFGSFNKARMLLRRFHRMTNEGARIIAESNDPYLTDNTFHLEYHKLNQKRKRMPGQAKIRVRYERYSTPWFDYLLVSKDEMINVVNGTGWKIDNFISSDGSAYIGIITKE